MTTQEISLDLNTKRRAFDTWLAGFKKDGSYDMTAEQVGEFHKRNDELTGLQKSYETALENDKTALTIEKAAAINEAKLAPAGRIVKAESPAEFKTGDRIETKAQLDAAFKSGWDANAEMKAKLANGGQGSFSFDINTNLKTLVTTSAMAPQADRQPATGSALYFGDVEDLLASGTTNSKSIDYYIQTTDTDNAAAVAEGSAVTDSAFSWTLTTDRVETVQDWIPVTREFLNDNAGIQSVVTALLAVRLQKVSNSSILAGNGSTPIPLGLLNRVTIQTQAKGSDPAFDAIHKALTLVRVTGDADPDAIVMHPTDWQGLRLTRTTQGVYILGNPTGEAGMFLWGLPVRQTTGLAAAGTALVGAFRQYSQVFNREGLTVETSTEHSTYFTERKVAIALSRRFAVACYRPYAFCSVTGL